MGRAQNTDSSCRSMSVYGVSYALVCLGCGPNLLIEGLHGARHSRAAGTRRTAEGPHHINTQQEQTFRTQHTACDMAIGCVRKHDSTRRVAGKIRRPLCQISDTHCRSRSGHGEPCHRKRTMTHAQCKVCKQTHGHRRSRHQQAISRQQEQSNDTTKAHQHDTQQEHIKHTARTLRTLHIPCTVC